MKLLIIDEINYYKRKHNEKPINKNKLRRSWRISTPKEQHQKKDEWNIYEDSSDPDTDKEETTEEILDVSDKNFRWNDLQVQHVSKWFG